MKKKKYIVITVIVGLLFTLPFISIPIFSYIQNPHNRYRADSASLTAHTIIIDGHFRVNTTSASESYLVYSNKPKRIEESTYDDIISVSVDLLNWNDNYIILSSKGSSGKESYMILERKTVEFEGFDNQEAFEQGQKERGIELELLDKKAFDWY